LTFLDLFTRLLFSFFISVLFNSPPFHTSQKAEALSTANGSVSLALSQSRYESEVMILNLLDGTVPGSIIFHYSESFFEGSGSGDC
jgi:hypothetical protein